MIYGQDFAAAVAEARMLIAHVLRRSCGRVRRRVTAKMKRIDFDIRAGEAMALCIRGLRTIAAACLAFLLGASTASAGHYELTKGSRYKLCREFAANLDLLGDLPGDTCNVPLDPRFEDFREIAWQALDPMRHLDAVREISVRLRSRGMAMDEAAQARTWQEAKPEVLEKARAGEIGLGRTRIDLNHDGARDTVYRYGRHRCTVPGPRGRQSFYWSYHVLKRDQEDLSRQMLMYAFSGRQAFYHLGRVYLALYRRLGDISVIEPTPVRQGQELAMIYVCQLDYVD